MQIAPAQIFHLAPQWVLGVGRTSPDGLKLLGSAFFVGQGKLATTKHVTGGDGTNLSVVLPRIGTMLDYEDTSNLQVQLAPARIVSIDSFRDICILQVAASAGDLPYHLARTEDVAPGDPVVTFGYPHAADSGRFVLTRQDAHVGARILIDAAGIKSKHIVMNTQARPGQSGGPVFAADASRVVAMIIGSYAPGGGGGISLGGIDPATLHQTTHAISAEYIAAML
jgi:S1-C subfamily serine protease